MSNKQETAVEFIQKQLRKYVRYDNRDAVETFDKIFEIAKEIEKEQIEEAFANGVDDEYEWHINNVLRKNSETYYNETYGGGQQ
jgi:predicted solute-binding protein